MLARFWRGEYSLVISFWVIAPVIVAVAFVLPEGVGWLVRGRDFNPFVTLMAIVAIWSIVVIAQLFLTIGLWRSAAEQRFDQEADSYWGLWGLSVQILVLVAAAVSATRFFLIGMPELGEGVSMALLDDPALPAFTVRLMRNGTEAEIAGGFKYGLERAAEAQFGSAPNLRVVHLNSAGGRLGEAIKIARLIRQRGLDTYTSATCASACAVAFAAGKERYLRKGAKLGFHRGFFAGSEYGEEMRKLLVAGGIAPAFAERAVAQPADRVWYPTDEELVAGHVVTAVVDSYRFAASGVGAYASLMVFEDALRRTPALEDLSETEPKLFEEMADLYLRRYLDGRSTGQIEDELRRTKIVPLITSRLPQASDDILVDYARLLADQSAALIGKDPADCFTFVTKGADARLVGLMGPDLQKRELALTERVLRGKVRRPPPTAEAVRTANNAVYKRLTAMFDAGAAAMLSDPAKVAPAQYELFCRVTVARLRTIASLPVHEAGDLMSGLFASARPANR